MNEGPATKSPQDLFERFSYLRAAYRKHQLKDVERPLARYKILAYALGQQAGRKPGGPVVVDPLAAPDDDHSPSCAICSKAFNQQRKSVPCTICGKRVCVAPPGCSDKLLVIAELQENYTQRVDTCLNCFKSLQWHKQKSEMKERNQKAQESVFCQLLRIVIESRDLIKDQLPKLKELLAISPNEITLEEWEHAKDYETALAEHFAAVDIGSKKISNIQFPHQRGKSVLANIKAAIITFQQLHSPEFMLLQKELKSLPKPPRDRTTEVMIAVEPVAVDDSPLLSAIDPIVHPVAGGKMTVTGVNFKPGITATFVGPTMTRKGEVQYMSSKKIVVWGPPLPSAIYSLVVQNDVGGSAELTDIIIYSDEPFRNAGVPSTAAPEPEWASELKAKERDLIMEEERHRKLRAADEAERKRREPPVQKAPIELSAETKQRLEEEKRREARKNWGRP